MNKSEIAERLKLTADTLPSYDECAEDIGPDDGKVFLRRFMYDNTPGEPDSENIFRHNLAEVLNEHFEFVERAIAESQAPQPSNDLLHKITDELTKDLQPLYTTMSPIPTEEICSLIAMKLLELAQHEYGQAFEFLRPKGNDNV